MLSYRATPLQGEKSPAKLFLGRKSRMEHQPNPVEHSIEDSGRKTKQDKDKRPESEHASEKGI